jgi:hypothetical protein
MGVPIRVSAEYDILKDHTSNIKKEESWLKLHHLVRLLVFALTGSNASKVSRFIMNNVFMIHGTYYDGPWSFRIISAIIMIPIYYSLLFIIGTAFGQKTYFKSFINSQIDRMKRVTGYKKIINKSN